MWFWGWSYKRGSTVHIYIIKEKLETLSAMESYLPTSDRHAASWIFSDGPSKQLGVVKLRYNALKLFFIMSLFYANVPVSVSDSRHGALRSTLRGWLIKTVCTNNSRRVYTNVVTRVGGSVGRLNPTTVVQMYRSKWWKFTFWNFAAVAYVAPQTVLAPTCQKRHAPHLKLCVRWNHTCRLA